MASFDWNEYHTLAQKLASNSDEASMRCAISRSYYCAFHIAKAYIKKADSTVGDKIGHFELWAKFFNLDGLGPVETYGERARMLRQKADYQNHVLRLEDDLTAALEAVEKVLTHINAKPLT